MDWSLPPKLWLPPKPAMIRAASMSEIKATFPFPTFVPSGAVTPLDITQFASQSSGTDASSYNMGTLSIGTAAAGRIVLVAIGSRRASAAAISGVTIGGNAATEVVTANNTDSGANIASIYGLQVNTGVTAEIIVTFNSTMLRCGVIIYALYNAPSVTPFATLTDVTMSSGVFSGNINVPANGAAMGVAWQSGAAGPTFTWSGLTKDAEQNVETANQTHGSASLEFATAQTPLAVSVTSSDTTTTAAAAWASWGP